MVTFAQRFPAQRPDLPVFPPRLRGRFLALDSGRTLVISPTELIEGRREHRKYRRAEFEALAQRPPQVAQAPRGPANERPEVRALGRDSGRESWWNRDTIFSLGGAGGGRLRQFQGRYYLSRDVSTGPGHPSWLVQRLEIDGRRLSWQTLGQDTLRLRALDPASVRRRREAGACGYGLLPAPGPQTRRVGRYAGLWQTEGEFVRQP